jgi:hypothetical protein
MNKHVRNLHMSVLSKTLNGPDPDKDIDKLYVPNRYLENLVSELVRDAADLLADYPRVDAPKLLLKMYGVKPR